MKFWKLACTVLALPGAVLYVLWLGIALTGARYTLSATLAFGMLVGIPVIAVLRRLKKTTEFTPLFLWGVMFLLVTVFIWTAPFPTSFDPVVNFFTRWFGDFWFGGFWALTYATGFALWWVVAGFPVNPNYDLEKRFDER